MVISSLLIQSIFGTTVIPRLVHSLIISRETIENKFFIVRAVLEKADVLIADRR